jgi:GT2 family glycosyltransferase
MVTPITFTITSCNRIDLLERTINSFLDLNNYPIDEFILSDDSGDNEIYDIIVNKFGNQFNVIKNKTRLGLSKSLDNLFLKSKNEYIFHCEDDWLFDKNPNLISDSLDILSENENIHQVSVRHLYDNPHKPSGDMLYTKKMIHYRLMSQNFMSMPTQIWNGYSWNPGLRRKSDYLKMFPDGISSFGDEYLCCDHTKKFNYLSAVLENTSCYHIGYNNRTPNFML